MANRGNVFRRMAPAKINLGLHILRRRADGFHDIETVMLPIGWHDVLQFVPSEQPFTFTCSDPSLPTDERNLCVRAGLLFAAAAGIELRGQLHLEKHIPHGAGLGGGSSDAAATLTILNQWWSARLPTQALYELAGMLGSDVPFMLALEPSLASGRGEHLRPLAGYRFPYSIAVVVPGVAVSTAEAYRMVRPSDHERTDLTETVASNDLQHWRECLVNDFEEPICERFPVISEARHLLHEAEAAYVALSGSGSAVYGVFESTRQAMRSADVARDAGFKAWAGGTLSRK